MYDFSNNIIESDVKNVNGRFENLQWNGVIAECGFKICKIEILEFHILEFCLKF